MAHVLCRCDGVRIFAKGCEELTKYCEGGGGEAETLRILGAGKTSEEFVAGIEEGAGVGEEGIEGREDGRG